MRPSLSHVLTAPRCIQDQSRITQSSSSTRSGAIIVTRIQRPTVLRSGLVPMLVPSTEGARAHAKTILQSDRWNLGYDPGDQAMPLTQVQDNFGPAGML